jgi:DNA primase
MEVVTDAGQRALLAQVLLGETKPPEEREVRSAIQEVQERSAESRLRALRAQIGEAERRGDYAEVAVLTREKMELDLALRELQKPAAEDL